MTSLSPTQVRCYRTCRESTSENIKKTVESTGLDIPFISDQDQSIMEKYGVAFNVTKDYQEKIVKFKGTTLEKINQQEKAVLPIPATYIIKDGKIDWVYFDPNYRERPSIETILAQL